VFSICTPYAAPSGQFFSLADLTNGPLPQFGYQMQLAGPEVEANVKTHHQVKRFLKALYDGRSERGRRCFRPNIGLDFEELKTIGASPLLDEEVGIHLL
jgi:soluble epoxide hydrolase/lipid-phosphate phosphatase